MSSIISSSHPFGSFRHNGTLPDSLFSQSYSSDSVDFGCEDSYQMAAPDNSMVESSTSHDSTHIYMNLLERSDLGNIMSTRFWTDNASGASDSDTSSSAASLIEDYRCGDFDQTLCHKADDQDFTVFDLVKHVTSTPAVLAENLPKDNLRQTIFPLQQHHCMGHISKVEQWLLGVEMTNTTQIEDIQSSSKNEQQKGTSLPLSPIANCDVATNSKSNVQHGTSTPVKPQNSLSVNTTALSHGDLSINSDAACCTQLRLVCGVTGDKLCKHRTISKKLKRVTKYLHKIIRTNSA